MLNNIINTIRKNIIQNNKNIEKFNNYINKLNIKYKNTLNNINQYFKKISKNKNQKLLNNYKNILYNVDKNFLETKEKILKSRNKIIQKNDTYTKLLKLSLSKKVNLKIFKINTIIIDKTKIINYIINIYNNLQDEIKQQSDKEKINILQEVSQKILHLKKQYSNEIQNNIIKLNKYIFN
tara:strand:+ start:1992 stop:2531 length:540 start_codon:yes stop_codon:yes gene_type:complete